MNKPLESNYKNKERMVIGLLSIATGFIVTYISIIGPLFLNLLVYKSSASGVFQFMGQDLLNLIFVAPMLIIGGILNLMKKAKGVSMLAFMPLYLIYYGLSYALGVEWSSISLHGNSEHYIYLYIVIVVNGLLILLYCIDHLKQTEMQFNKRALLIYSVLASILTLFFAMSYIQAINLNLLEPSKEYLKAPALFWFVKTFDLCFLVPLMGISIYLLWTRPLKSYLLQLLNFGFFITMTSAVNSMAIIMLLKGDQAYSLSAHSLFIVLEIVSLLGFAFVLKGTKGVNI